MPTCSNSQCSSTHVRISRYNRNGTAYYLCQDCGHYFNAGHQDHPTEPALAPSTFEDHGDGTAEATTAVWTDPPTLDQALRLFDIDQEVWVVERWISNVWGNLSAPSYQIKLWLRRRVAVETALPPVQPISFPLLRPYHCTRPQRQSGCAVVASDAHLGYRRDFASGKLLPYHDRFALDALLGLCNALQPERILLLGDMLDSTEFTDKFVRSPEFYQTFQPSLIELAWWLARLRQVVPGASIQWVEGNHEERLPTYLMVHLSSAYQVHRVGQPHDALSMPGLLPLADLGIEWIPGYPDAGVWLNEKLFATHADKHSSRPGETAAKIIADASASVLFGHIHRRESVAKTRYLHNDIRTYYAESFGMLGNPRRTPGRQANQDWQQGVGVVYFDAEGLFDTHYVPLFGDFLLYEGQHFVGQDYTQQLQNETQWGIF